MTEENKRHGEILKYMLGWHKGAGMGAIGESQWENPDFRRGYDDGREASRRAYDAAKIHYGAELSIIKPAGV